MVSWEDSGLQVGGPMGGGGTHCFVVYKWVWLNYYDSYPQVVVTDSDTIQNFVHSYKDFTAVFCHSYTPL